MCHRWFPLFHGLGRNLLVLGLLTATAHAGTIYVNGAASGANNGSSWADAYTDLQSALAVAVPGDDIWVAAGTYKPTSGSDRTLSFALKTDVGVYGGFAGTETLLSERNWTSNVTVLSGDLGTADDYTDNSYHVVTSAGCAASAVLDGFTVTGGNANRAAYPDNYGGGMCNSQSSPTLSNCSFTANSALEGGGMFNVYLSSLPTLTNCSFTANSARSSGGGMLNSDSSPTLTNCTFSANSADYGGGMFNVYLSSLPTLTNCSFTGNSASYYGGGIYNGLYVSPTLTNCILWGDTAGTGAEIYCDIGGTATVTYSDVQGGYAGTGNINADPRFVGVGDYRLQAGSPCIDAANGDAAPPTDSLSNARRDDPATPNTGTGTPPYTDIGAYEYQASGVASALAFTVQPANTVAGASLSAVQVAVLDVLGNTVTTATDAITLSLGANPGGATLAGTLTVNAVAGLASFSDLSINRAGVGYTLTASAAGLASATSNAFDIAPPSQLVFAVQPGETRAGATISPAVQVAVQDALGNTVTTATDAITLALGANPGGGTLAGTLTVNAVAGLASFSDLRINRPGAGYTLTASAAGLVGATSRAFKVMNTIYVKANATGANTGNSWADAFTELQSALTAAVSGNDIWVAAGTYRPTSGTDRTVSFALVNGVGVYGGFAGTETLLSERNWTSNVTVLSGDLGTPGDAADNSYHVVTSAGCAATAVLDGFTVTGGNANRTDHWPDNWGGGMYNSGSSPTLRNCTFTDNSADHGGGGMTNVSSSSPTLSNCTFSDNSAFWGGGMCNLAFSSPTLSNCCFAGNSVDAWGGGMDNDSFSSPTLTNCTFSANSASSGGGMGNHSSSPTLSNCSFTGNSAGYGGGGGMGNSASFPTLSNCTFTANSAQYGGGIHSNSTSSPTLTNCTFAGNSAAWNGGGMDNTDSSSATLSNCTFTGNSAIQGCGGGIHSNSTSSPTLSNCILWGDTASTGAEIYCDGDGTATVTYSDVQGGYAGTGNLDADPRFIGAGDCRLQAGSPCIDAANGDVAPPTDSLGHARYDDPATPNSGTGTPSYADLGAYERQAAGIATGLAFVVQPASAVAGASLGAVQVAVQDDFGNTIATATAAITVALGANPGGGTLAGTLTVNAVAGLATFNDLSINRAGVGYTLTAGATGLAGTTSSTFDITPGPPSQLVFTVQPRETRAGATISPAVQVAVQDALGNTVTAATDAITVAIGSNPGGETLAGTLTVNAVTGLANFNDLRLDRAGVGYTLTANAAGLAGATSSTFDITPYGPGPHLVVRGQGQDIANGDLTPSAADDTDFGLVVAGLNHSHTFTLANLGAADLTLDGTPSVALGGPQAGDFTVTAAPATPVAPGTRTTFTINFTPGGPGVRQATVSIATNDSDANPFVFAIQGAGQPAQISVTGNGILIAAGDLTPDTADGTEFGDVAPGQSRSHSFTIRNLGAADLVLDGTPPVALDGPQAADFTVTAQPATLLAPGASTTFTVQFAPGGTGSRDATVHIAFNDAVWSPYEFAIRGYGSYGLVVWGDNEWGQCNQPSPNLGYIAAAAGWGHSLMLKADGSVVGWGGNWSHQCNPPSPNSGFTAVSGGASFSLGLKADGSIVAWGTNSDGQGNVPSPNTGFTAVSAGAYHSLGLKADGTVVAWGRNTDGQCNVPAPNADFVAISAGAGHSLGLKADGTIVAWGGNSNGECNVPSPNSGFIAVAAGCSHSLGLKADGSIVGWGANDNGQCDPPAPNSGFVAVAAGAFHSLGLKPDGSLVVWGYNDYGQCDVPFPNTGFVAIAGGAMHSLALKPPFPTLRVTGKGQAIANGDTTPTPDDDTAFRSAAVGGAPVTHTFTIANTGGADLTLDGTPSVALSGPQAGDFAVTAAPGTPVAPGATTTFAISFTPGGPGVRRATISIANNDAGANPHTFAIQGTGPGPAMDVLGNGLSIANGDDTPAVADDTDFGTAAVSGNPVTHTFTVANLGAADLTLDGTPPVVIAGAHPADFTVTATPTSPVTPGGQVTFAVTFAPLAAGLRTALVRLANNDVAGNPYEFAVQGNGLTAPAIIVSGRGVAIANGDVTPTVADDTDFGSVPAGTGTWAHTFTIHNIGTGDLNLTGTPAVALAGAAAADFTVTTPPASPVAAGGTTTFTVTFSAPVVGLRAATVSVANDAPDANPYVFAIQGTGILAPEIGVTGNGVVIANGDDTPAVADDTDFGSLRVGGGEHAHTFTILNLGSADLHLTGTPRVTLSGPHPADFLVWVQPGSPVPAGGSTFCIIRFAPTGGGLRSATVAIASDDADGNPYTFAIQGTGKKHRRTVALADGSDSGCRLAGPGTADGSLWLSLGVALAALGAARRRRHASRQP